MTISELEACFDRNVEQYHDEWRRLLAIPSVSTDPAHEDDCERCAAWLVESLAASGFEAKLLPTSSKPVVFAQRNGDTSKPTVLFYGHYDVQPPDPLEAWVSPPFEPTIRNGRLYARGAEDNKGQLLYALKAFETLVAGEHPAPTIKILIEGEEEYGSTGIAAALPDWTGLVRADILLVTDTHTVSSGDPTIIMGLRGLVYLALTLSGADHDLHSGTHGGLAPNPATGLCRLLASLHARDGSIAIPGFYDGLEARSSQESRLAAAESFDPQHYVAETGVAPVGGESGRPPVERVGFRPSLDVNGISGGYTGDGIKTIIPSRASAKITARLAAGQVPERCLQMIIEHLEANVPDGLSLAVEESGAAGPGFRLNPDSPLVARARTVLHELTGREAVLHWEGASIPIVAALARTSGAEPLLCGFGSEADRAHAPNESFGLDRFRLGFLYVASLIGGL